MEKKINFFYDSKGDTLNIWFDDPKKEVSSEETGEEVILSKDKTGRVIGFEKLNFTSGKIKYAKPSPKTFPVELVMS